MMTGIMGEQVLDYVINDFNGQPVRLSDDRGWKHVVPAYSYPAT